MSIEAFAFDHGGASDLVPAQVATRLVSGCWVLPCSGRRGKEPNAPVGHHSINIKQEQFDFFGVGLCCFLLFNHEGHKVTRRRVITTSAAIVPAIVPNSNPIGGRIFELTRYSTSCPFVSFVVNSSEAKVLRKPAVLFYNRSQCPPQTWKLGT